MPYSGNAYRARIPRLGLLRRYARHVFEVSGLATGSCADQLINLALNLTW